MKKTLCTALALVVAISCTACAKEEKSSDEKTQTDSTASSSLAEVQETEPIFLDKSGQNKKCVLNLIEQDDGKLVYESADNAFKIVCSYSYADKTFSFNADFENQTDYDVVSDCRITPVVALNTDKKPSYISDLTLKLNPLNAHESINQQEEIKLDDVIESGEKGEWISDGENNVSLYVAVEIILTGEDDTSFYYNSEETQIDFVLDESGNTVE